MAQSRRKNSHPDLVADVKVAGNGRMVLPRAVRDALGIGGPTRLILRVQDGKVQLSTVASITENVRRIYRENTVHNRSTEDFLADRKKEAEAELRGE